ncbi:MAG: RpiB/LacA/LacB family sugar-phosphate isomerase [Sphaerochaetaceae bacterium]|jgi:ribose 5-phosphate isomerase B|nr:RpiB/LacA/LacB family sugar-phosphate isomerase [Sphaerochaetaceae bacterium]MDD3365970.1 RpiB/LacA/LacB family sugar-phosphate isomerase [Sphaerochaetaceae bacterium]MDD4218772.1 RpiB/LacA/LacB family sugar-phosphate isomerase [Sphaerochaetaceae bacterium]MDY0371081.1 RpiB/LacA/LacB family sugar-phosphate isomerase [Sphaerochaetaceae bacterium]
MKKVVVANDHGAVDVTKRIVEHLKKRGYSVNHLGVTSPDSVDYPDMAAQACGEFLAGGYEFGVVACGTGIGISISANKINGIRCALPQNVFAATMAKSHNNANFIAFGGRIEYTEPVEKMLDAFIDSPVEGGRHTKRVNKMMALEGGVC